MGLYLEKTVNPWSEHVDEKGELDCRGHRLCDKEGYPYERLNNGSFVVTIKGETDYTIGVGAHVDTLGLMVRSIKGNGNLALTKLGGPITATLDAEYCKVYTRDGKVYSGTVLSNSPAAHVFKDASSLPRDADHMHIRLDEVVKSKADVKKLGIESSLHN